MIYDKTEVFCMHVLYSTEHVGVCQMWRNVPPYVHQGVLEWDDCSIA